MGEGGLVEWPHVRDHQQARTDWAVLGSHSRQLEGRRASTHCHPSHAYGWPPRTCMSIQASRLRISVSATCRGGIEGRAHDDAAVADAAATWAGSRCNMHAHTRRSVLR